MKKPFLFFYLFLVHTIGAQPIDTLEFDFDEGMAVSGFVSGKELVSLDNPYPLFSILINDRFFSTLAALKTTSREDTVRFQLAGLQGKLWQTPAYSLGLRYELQLQNITQDDTLIVENLVPFGESSEHVYITGQGNHGLSRTYLFRPGLKPVNLIVPDNAWELGYASIKLTPDGGLSGLARRKSWKQAQRRRFETHIYPGGEVVYHLWFDAYEGVWQESLRHVFQKRALYDLERQSFDDALYRRKDLQWIRRAYAMHLIMGWDRDFYDAQKQTYQLEEFLQRARRLYGGNDVVGIWSNWPTLGLDQRNQWDLLRDLPGETQRIRRLAEACREQGARFFISYNPWDESTRWEDHHAGMSDMIQALAADGVVLDTEGKSSREHQNAADRVRPGVIMYSEGMAVPRDMPGIVAGRVHNALYYPPLLNLNKFIRPDFAIFRVAELYKDRIRREYALSFFNGYGTEINQFRPGRPTWMEEDYCFWGRLLMIQRENADNFTSFEYTPLIPAKKDQIYINKWPREHKTIYTLFSLLPEGYLGPLFEIPLQENFHLVDLWNHREIEADTLENQWLVSVDLEGFSAKWLGTNNEGAVGAIAVLPRLLEVNRQGDLLHFSASKGDLIRIWQGLPSYEKLEESDSHFETAAGSHPQSLRLSDHFDRCEGKFVVQLFAGEELLDETIFEIPPGLARLISEVEKTPSARETPQGMVQIPAGRFRMKVTFGDNFIPHPQEYPSGTINMSAFFMDKHPVTNEQYKVFLNQSDYIPKDTTNFLRHWHKGKIPQGREHYPVVYVGYEDAQAYARWAKKRLPTEIEWQYAAQTPDLREWPWAKDAAIKRERQIVTNTLTVSKLQVDSSLCNTGDGNLYPVGSYPKGANPYGLEDLVGCVWQLTNDIYDNGTNYFGILKGGGYFLPASSWWYVEGGPRELTYSQKLLRLSPGFERNATVGFRCVKDP